MADTPPRSRRTERQAPPAAERPTPTGRQRFWQEVRGYAEALAIAFLVVTFVFNTVGVVGSSMRPNLDGGVGSSNVLRSLLTGDRVFIPKYDTWLRRAGVLGAYARGDIIVVRDPLNSPSAIETGNRPFFIKRIVAIGGDRLRIEGGQVIVNGHAIDQGYITESGEISPDRQDFPVVSVRDGRVEGLVVRFGMLPSGTAFPDLPTSGTNQPPVPIDDPRVQLYYGPTVASLAPLPADAPDDGTPFVHDLVVPEGHYFIMGDNRQRSRGGSEDSRVFGPVPAMSVAGRASAIIWPPQRHGEWNWRVLSPPAAFERVPPPRAD
ncbi:MAG: signal peptidase I [Trueperaceae bacterium]|nr:signal peptidase I [Trueperaceae bacterium]